MSNSRQRNSLRLERLESRAMLAGDMPCDHNAMLPEDTNGNGDVTAIDALIVINEIARSARSRNGGSQLAGDAGSPSANMTDVNADGKATAIDALFVINRVGRTSRGGSLASRVPIEDRINRLAADIESGTLPRNLDLTTAMAILARLQSGKLPEVENSASNSTLDDTKDEEEIGDEGVGVDDVENDDEDSTDNSGEDQVDEDPADDSMDDDDLVDEDDSVDDDESGDGMDHSEDCPDSAERLSHRVERISERLEELGVSAEVMTNVATAFSVAIDAEEPLTRAEILKLLADAGVSTAILDQLTKRVPGGERHDPANAIERLSEKLLENGNDPAVVETLVAELNAAVDAGTPLDREQVKARMEALGLNLPTREPHDRPNAFERLEERLLENGNDPEIVADLIAELEAAVDAGTPLSREEVKARIEELGLDLPRPAEMPTKGRFVGRLHAIRDAYFASLAGANK